MPVIQPLIQQSGGGGGGPTSPGSGFFPSIDPNTITYTNYNPSYYSFTRMFPELPANLTSATTVVGRSMQDPIVLKQTSYYSSQGRPPMYMTLPIMSSSSTSYSYELTPTETTILGWRESEFFQAGEWYVVLAVPGYRDDNAGYPYPVKIFPGTSDGTTSNVMKFLVAPVSNDNDRISWRLMDKPDHIYVPNNRTYNIVPILVIPVVPPQV